jgi:hypothetical protein
MKKMGAYGMLYTGKYRDQGKNIDVVVKYIFGRSLKEAYEIEAEAKIALRLQSESAIVKIYDSFFEARNPGY